MIKKTMLAACFAALAFAALPALAAAAPNPYLADEGTPVSSTAFTVSGSETTELNTVGGSFVKCTSVSGSGEFETAETGTINLEFKGCTTIFSIPCTTSGKTSGTIVTTALPFHLKTVEHEGKESPGVLITPGSGETAHGGSHYATFSCSFAGKVEVGGNGIVGTITSPEEGVPSNTATLSFQKKSNGVQTHTTVTNDNKELTAYSLKSSFNGGGTEGSSQNGKGTITFAGGMEPEILTTDE